MSEWADRYRFLSPEASAEPGLWSTERTPYLRFIMDAYNDPTIHTIVVKSSAQCGKTEVLLNIIGRTVHQDPGPIMCLQPTITMAETFSTDRLAPMLRDSPALKGLVKDPKSRDAGNTKLWKRFPGGHISLAGANSPASLASRPIRDLLADEVDRYPVSAGTEGDPVNLAIKRTTTFWNRKIFLTSTPTSVNGRINLAFNEGDQRYFYVPCPDCGEEQVLRWDNVRWLKDSNKQHLPETAYYACEHCGSAWDDVKKNRAVSAIKEARPSKPTNGIASFHLWEIYSPWVTMEDLVSRWLRAQQSPQQLKTFINTALGETFDDSSSGADADTLVDRVEDYGPSIPEGAYVLTAGVDVQPDRLEVDLTAWGKDFTSWGLEYRVIQGSPNDHTSTGVWAQLTKWLDDRFPHANGLNYRVSRVFIDMGGHNADDVNRFILSRAAEGRYFAVKGSSHPGQAVVNKPAGLGKYAVKPFIIGTDTAKSMIMHWLSEVNEPTSPGYKHFRRGVHSEKYFHGLVSERKIQKFKNGQFVDCWVKPDGRRNEPLDCAVYCLAAMSSLQVDWNGLVMETATLLEKKQVQASLPSGQVAQQTKPPSAAINRQRRRVTQMGKR